MSSCAPVSPRYGLTSGSRRDRYARRVLIDLDQYLFPTIMIGVIVLAVTIAITWLIIFTAVRAALRSVQDDEHRYNTSDRYGLPPR